jgi:hypothetical protein
MIHEIMMKAHAVRKADVLTRLARSQAQAKVREATGTPTRKPRSEVRMHEMTTSELEIIENMIKDGYKLAMVRFSDGNPPEIQL